MLLQTIKVIWQTPIIIPNGCCLIKLVIGIFVGLHFLWQYVYCDPTNGFDVFSVNKNTEQRIL